MVNRKGPATAASSLASSILGVVGDVGAEPDAGPGERTNFVSAGMCRFTALLHQANCQTPTILLRLGTGGGQIARRVERQHDPGSEIVPSNANEPIAEHARDVGSLTL
jgi:hypothetical protein